MSGVRLLVGTRKGAFILTSDERRQTWAVDGPHFPGWEMYHVNGSPVDPNRLYASQSTSWFGQLIQRSDDGGHLESDGNDFTYAGVPARISGTTARYDPGSSRGWASGAVPDRRDTVYAGVQDAALFRSTDGAGSGTS